MLLDEVLVRIHTEEKAAKSEDYTSIINRCWTYWHVGKNATSSLLRLKSYLSSTSFTQKCQFKTLMTRSSVASVGV